MPERTYPIEVVNSVLPPVAAMAPVIKADEPPVAGARLGRTPDGEPAWYVPDPARPGKYLQYTADAPKGDGCTRWPGCCCGAATRANCAARDAAGRTNGAGYHVEGNAKSSARSEQSQPA
jgi:hypothetical protein